MSDLDSSTRSLEKRIETTATPQQVWKAIATPEGIRQWYAPVAEVVPGEGGTMQLSWGEGMTGTLDIVVWESGRHLRVAGPERTPPGKGTRGRLIQDWTIDTLAGKTQLRLVESGFGADASWNEEYASHERGWNQFLAVLEHALTFHRDRPGRQVEFLRLTGCDAEACWARITGPRGFGGYGQFQSRRPGEDYTMRSSGGDHYSGTVILFAPPLDFVGTVREWNNGVLRISFERLSHGAMVNVVLHAWEVPDEALDGLQARWAAMFKDLYPEKYAKGNGVPLKA